MKSKLNYLINISLMRKIKTKWFVIANIILSLVIVGVLNIDTIITKFGGDFDEAKKIYVIDNSKQSFDYFKEQMNNNSSVLNTDDVTKYEVISYDKTIDDAKALIKEEKEEIIFIIFNNDENNVINVTVMSDGYIDMVDYQIINASITNTKVNLAISNSDISTEELTKIYSPVEIERIILDESKNKDDESMEMIMTTVFPVIILPFFMLSIFLVQMIGAEVNDEKTTRSMEIIISNVSPKTHFFAKVIAGNLFVLIQGALLLAFSGIGMIVRKLVGGNNIVNGLGDEVGKMIDKFLSSGISDKLIYIIPITLLIMVLTFIAYSLLAGVLASMTTNIEDFQQLQTPIMIISLVGYYLSMMAGMFEGALFIKILSYVPFISAILSPSLLILGQIGVIDVLISLALIILTNYLLIKYGLKIYKVGILNYSSKDLWKKMFKAIKE